MGGIGTAICQKLAKSGFKVIAGCGPSRDFNKWLDEQKALGFHFHASVGNVADWGSTVDAFGKAIAEHGQIDVLVNNAGMVVPATPESTTLEQFRLHNAIMSEGVFLGCKHAIPAMNASGGGSIINMASVATHLGYPVFFAYSAAKGAVRGMTKSIAVWCQMQKYNIRCNSLHPGATDTPMLTEASKLLGIPDEFYTQSGPGLGRPEDVANVVVFLASDESRFINGAELVLDNCLTIQ